MKVLQIITKQITGKAIANMALGALLLLIAWNTKAQADATKVFASPDFSKENPQGLVVKWFADKVYYPKGFNVYRQEQGSSEWQLISKTPVNVKDRVPTYLAAQYPDTKELLKQMKDMEYEEFQKSLMRVFVLITTVEHPEFAKVVGNQYHDTEAEAGKLYQYKVEGILNSGAKEYIGISASTKTGTYTPIYAIQDLTIDRKRRVVNINWKPEPGRYFGVHVYRKEGAGDYQRLTKNILSPQKSEGPTGKLDYPKVLFEDFEIAKEKNYTYKLIPIDYFGQEGAAKELVANSKDFDPPKPPFDVKADARLLGVALTWKHEQGADQTVQKVYRRSSYKGEWGLLATVGAGDTSYLDQVPEAGGYYYTIGALDEAGNESRSQEIVIDVHDMIPPAVPQNVRVATDTGRVKLTWDPVGDKDLMGYFIYKSLSDENNDDNEFVVVNKNPVSTTAYTEALPKKVKNTFVYKVVSVDSNYNRSEYSSLSQAQLPDVTPPVKPFIKNIHIDAAGIKLEWLKYHEPGLAGFDVFRSDAEDSASYAKVNKSLIDLNATFYNDAGVIAGQNYYYYMVAEDLAGNRSEPSGVFKGMGYAGNQVSIKSSEEEGVQDFKGKYNKKKKGVKLSWKEPVDDYLGIIVYKGTNAKNMAPITGKLKSDNYLDRHHKEGTVFYQVRLYDEGGKKYLSQKIEVSIKN